MCLIFHEHLYFSTKVSNSSKTRKGGAGQVGAVILFQPKQLDQTTFSSSQI